jgi:hypothetical protein
MHHRQWLADLMVNMMRRVRHIPCQVLFRASRQVPGLERLCRYSVLAVVFVGSVGGGAAIAQGLAQPSVPESAFEHCRAMPDDASRLRCYEDLTKPQQAVPPPSPLPSRSGGTWRLVRTPNPAEGPEAVSIMQTADIGKSDLDLAGLMLRCGQTGTEILIVLVQPLPPRARPKVSVSTGGGAVDFTATVVPPGALVLLPQDASALAKGPWQNAAELTVDVEDSSERVKGVIPLAGLGDALSNLLANCPQH